MREADRRAIEELGIPGFTLMEVAGRAVAEEAMFMLDEEDPGITICLCGKGNNGGDGFVAARVLHQAGIDVDVCLTSDPENLVGNAKAHFDLLEQIVAKEDGLRILRSDELDSLDSLSGGDLYIDALLGTGISNQIREPVAGVIDWLNQQTVPVLAVDLPSGLDADTGRVLGRAVRADVTVTMAAIKSGLLVGDGPDYAGAVLVAEIGIPHHILDEVSTDDGRIRLCQREYVTALLPSRARNAHKYATGPTIVIGGSENFTGAPVLAATAAARIGSGYVGVVCPDEIAPILSEKLTEIPVAPLRRNGANWNVEQMISDLGNRWVKAKSLLIGPGLGRDPVAKELVVEVLKQVSMPVVIDADGLFALIDEKEFVRTNAHGKWIFTPHSGEFELLCKNGGHSINESPIRAARAFATEWKVIVLLKGMPSVTAAPNGDVIINDTGNPAAATAGSGDVLSGMVAGLLAQGLSPLEAATAGIHIGGALADKYALEHSMSSMMAGDLLAMIPDFLTHPD